VPAQAARTISRAQALEVLADDSNFREAAMAAAAAPAAAALSLPPARFESAWCAGARSPACHSAAEHCMFDFQLASRRGAMPAAFAAMEPGACDLHVFGCPAHGGDSSVQTDQAAAAAGLAA